ncbi:MAG: polymerase subunit tau [Planctomycetota bacterium]|jgi:DNA polymerase III delta' subunit
MRLAEVLGQPAAVALLARLLDRGRLPKALLLAGPPGCGRRTLARAVAQALLCPSPVAGDACGHCRSCALAAAGTHPDLGELPGDRDAADEDGDQSRALKVDTVRALADQAMETPIAGARRAFIIPACERLSAGEGKAANALLKVLEEPPAGTWFILTAASPDGVLPTIRSRTQVVRLGPLPAPDLARILVARGIAAAEADRLALLGAGSHRDLDGAAGDSPVDDLVRLLAEGYRGDALAAIMARLPKDPDAAEHAAGLTIGMVHRRRVRLWFAALRVDLRARLRRGDAAAADWLERTAQAESDLGVNIPVRSVLEMLAAPERG